MLKASYDKYRPSGDQSTPGENEISGPRVSSVSSAPDPSDGLRRTLIFPSACTPYAIYFPSGDHTLHSLLAGPNIIRVLTPPAAGSDHKSLESSFWGSTARNKICLPSGEILGARRNATWPT